MRIDKKISLGRGGEEADSVSPITFRINAGAGVPPYLQLVQQVEHALRLGYLQKGDQLPRVKDVVGSLSINPNTVLKAYRELEHKGIAAGRPGQGTFIEAAPDTVGLEILARLRRSLVRGWLAEAAAAGLGQDEIVALFTVALQEALGSAGVDPKDGKDRDAGRADHHEVMGA
jgi:GntR family transcriptional regulator